LLRTAPPHRILDPGHPPLIAVRLYVLTRKTLGGLETDLEGRALRLGHRAPACLLRARRPDSAVAACTDTARWKDRSGRLYLFWPHRGSDRVPGGRVKDLSAADDSGAA
jgi:hypothetical protein